MRKNINDLKNSLENVVIPMFCSADLIANTDQRQKLAKLLSLWESKAKFFDACVISKLQSPDSSMQEYKTNLQNTHHDITANFTQNTNATLDNYQKQHQVFIQHASQQISQLEKQAQHLEQQIVAQKSQQQHMLQHQQKNIPSLMSHRIPMPGDHDHMNSQGPHDQQHPQAGNNMYPGGNFHQQQQQQQPPGNPFADPRGPNFFIPDMSKPPPGFAGPPIHHNQGPAIGHQQQQPQPGQFPQLQGSGNEPPVDLGVLSAAIQACLQMQQQHHPDDPQQPGQHQLQQQQQQQPPPMAAYPQNIVRPVQQNADSEVDLDVLNAAIRAVITNKSEDGTVEDGQQPQKLVDGESGDPVVIGEPQIPTAPYYDLPAGLMVPLIRLEDYNYKALDPADIRLPAPAPQSERLTNALNAFYSAPSHDRPRDNEGWEKLGLYEYYKVKNAARKQKEEEIKDGIREKSRSPSPIVLEKPLPKKSNKRVYRSKSRSRSRSKTPPLRDRSASRSRSRSRSMERSLTPPPTNRNRSGGGSNRKGRNRSPRHERDNSGSTNSNRESRGERGNSNSRDNGNSINLRRVDRDRSPTPPSFLGSTFAKPAEFIEESNKGHQMLMKMGWAGTGTGLGSKNQGIDTPISGGEVRDRREMYKGVGANMHDPFESFRKNKGAAFAHRMRSRDDKS
ncbi:calcium homeostasis endoplasmic reticulum protein isoform X2 [Drosophila teissieri]|nr:calcium homeostasis endoplasmic reticulum protein isoform X2 [Drosophila teissieri]